MSKTETRPIGAFDEISLRTSAKVEVTKGDQPKLVITADDNILPVITTEVDGDALIISSTEGFSAKTKIQIKLEVPLIIQVQLGGSGEVSLDSVTDKKLVAKISGSGDIVAKGEVEDLECSINGSGDLNFAGLKARTVEVKINGSGDANVFASDSLDVRINGSGDVQYWGNPNELKSKVNGSGDIRRKR